MPAAAHDAWLAWYASMPDAPCIAICSTSQGDAVCKGCGRTFEEVQHWTAMTPGEKRATWRRITQEGTAWRFNRYAERASGDAARDGSNAARRGMTRIGLRQSARRLAPLAWPVFVGQVAVLAFSTVDTVMVARASALDLAALAVGASVYISIFVGLMGVVLAIGPIAGQLFGAGKLKRKRPRGAAGDVARAGAVDPRLRPAALARAVPGAGARRSRGRGQGARLPARTGVRVAAGAGLHRLSRLQRRRVAAEGGDGDAARRAGAEGAGQRPARLRRRVPTPFGSVAIPALGAAGCGMATAIVMWCQLGAAFWWLRRDPFYRRFGLGRGIVAAERGAAWRRCCASACRWAWRS